MDEWNEFVDVRVLVPRSRVAEFYEMHSRWLRGERGVDARGDTFKSNLEIDLLDDKGESGLPRDWTQGSEAGRLADAINVYDRLSPGAKKILDVLIEHQGKAISGDALAKQLNLSTDKLTGTLASLNIRCSAVGREVPYRYTSGPRGGKYAVDPNIAELFLWARAPEEEILEAARSFEDARRDLLDPKSWMSRVDSDPTIKKLRHTVNELNLSMFGKELVEEFQKSRQPQSETEISELPEPEAPIEEVHDAEFSVNK